MVGGGALAIGVALASWFDRCRPTLGAVAIFAGASAIATSLTAAVSERGSGGARLIDPVVLYGGIVATVFVAASMGRAGRGRGEADGQTSALTTDP